MLELRTKGIDYLQSIQGPLFILQISLNYPNYINLLIFQAIL